MYDETQLKIIDATMTLIIEKGYSGATDYSGPAAHLGRSLAQLDRASAHLIQSAFRHMPIADQPIY